MPVSKVEAAQEAAKQMMYLAEMTGIDEFDSIIRPVIQHIRRAHTEILKGGDRRTQYRFVLDQAKRRVEVNAEMNAYQMTGRLFWHRYLYLRYNGEEAKLTHDEDLLFADRVRAILGDIVVEINGRDVRVIDSWLK